jgi:limonene-1,2-epoxide hydrolase
LGFHADLLAELFKALERLDFGGVAELCSDDCVYEDVPYPEATVVGPTAIRAKLELGLTGLERLVTEIHELVEDEETALVERTEVWHHATGERAKLRIAAVFKFRGTKLTLWRDYWDAKTLLDQQPAAWLPEIPRLTPTKSIPSQSTAEG